MRIQLFSLLMLLPAMSFAMQCDETFFCTGGVSKKDIKELSEKLKDHSFNGKPFSLKAVQKMFKKSASLEKPENKDYGPYWDKRRQFEQEYGPSRESELLFDLAKADFYIKKYEQDHGIVFDEDQEIVTDYRFIGDGRTEFHSMPKTSSCIIDAKIGEGDTTCEHDPGSSGLLGSLLYIGTMGNFGDPNSARRENTTCITEKPVHALIRTSKDGKNIVYAANFIAKGRATEFDKNVWFRHGLKVDSKEKCDQDAVQIEEELVLYSCDKHESADQQEFNRSPAVIEQFGRKLKQLQANQ